MAADSLTVRADGVDVGSVFVGSKAVMLGDVTFTAATGFVRNVVQSSKSGKTWTEKETLEQYLCSVAASRAEESIRSIVEKCKSAAIVTVKDEYRY